jgi:hypothetical protein
MAHAVSRRLPTAAARVRAQVRSREICCGQNGSGAGILQVLRFPLPILIPAIAPHSSSIIRGLYNRPVNGRRTKWTHKVSPHPKKLRRNQEVTLRSGTYVPMWRRNLLSPSFGVEVLKMETVHSSETLVPTYQNSRRHIPDVCNLKVAYWTWSQGNHFWERKVDWSSHDRTQKQTPNLHILISIVMALFIHCSCFSTWIKMRTKFRSVVLLYEIRVLHSNLLLIPGTLHSRRFIATACWRRFTSRLSLFSVSLPKYTDNRMRWISLFSGSLRL